MKINQLSVFVENKPGRLAMPCRLLANAGINIVTLSLADTQQFGILRILARDWQKAREVLQQAGMVVKITEVLAVEVPDHPGGLADVLDVLGQSDVNVEYMYAFAEKLNDKAILVFRFSDPDQAILALGKSQVNVINHVELYERLEKG
jgi:hypothetical protein